MFFFLLIPLLKKKRSSKKKKDNEIYHAYPQRMKKEFENITEEFNFKHLERKLNRILWVIGILLGVFWSGIHFACLFVDSKDNWKPIIKIIQIFCGLSICGSLLQLCIYFRKYLKSVLLIITKENYNSRNISIKKKKNKLFLFSQHF